MKRVKKYMNGTSEMFSNLAGERVTRKEVIAAHVGCAAVIIGAMSDNAYILSKMKFAFAAIAIGAAAKTMDAQERDQK